jgi:transposase-like protein
MKKVYSPGLKFKVALAALTGQPIVDICKQYEVSDGLVHKWKKEFKERGAEIFSPARSSKDVAKEADIARLYQRIGQLSTENEFLKKVVGE